MSMNHIVAFNRVSLIHLHSCIYRPLYSQSTLYNFILFLFSTLVMGLLESVSVVTERKARKQPGQSTTDTQIKTFTTGGNMTSPVSLRKPENLVETHRNGGRTDKLVKQQTFTSQLGIRNQTQDLLILQYCAKGTYVNCLKPFLSAVGSIFIVLMLMYHLLNSKQHLGIILYVLKVLAKCSSRKVTALPTVSPLNRT